MPRREVTMLLQDMLDYGGRAEAHMGTMSKPEYRNDWLRRDAVERCLIVVGEALNQARQQRPELASRITSAQRIVDFRNIVVHGYAMIEPEVVWDIVRVHLPVLLDEVRMIRAADSGEASS
jgi:uncharacterized protein with HEPN domain